MKSLLNYKLVDWFFGLSHSDSKAFKKDLNFTHFGAFGNFNLNKLRKFSKLIELDKKKNIISENTEGDRWIIDEGWWVIVSMTHRGVGHLVGHWNMGHTKNYPLYRIFPFSRDSGSRVNLPEGRTFIYPKNGLWSFPES